jgi:uncharacterized protein
MAIKISSIYRYPVKGLSPERLKRAALTPGECLPHDRRFALALGSTVFDPQHPQWLPKTKFVMLMRDEQLALLQTAFDADSDMLTVAQDGRVLLRAALTEPAGYRQVAQFYTDFLGPGLDGPLRVVEAPGHAFADARRRPNATAGKYVSLINLASIGALEQAMDAAIDPLRFRANVYFDGAPAWTEHDWIGAEITLGPVRLHIVSPITRGAATQVNPETAERDLDIPAALTRHFGHIHMGLYAEVLTAATISSGDKLRKLSPTPH